MELQELADVVKSGAAILNSTEDGAEVVVEELDISGILGNIGTSDAHGKADIRTMKRGSVVCAITCDGNSTTNLNQTVHEHKFVIRLRTRHNLEFLFDLFELTDVSNSALYANFIILRALFLLNTAINLAAELLASHANVILLVSLSIHLRENASFASDGSCSLEVVASNHADINSSKVA